MIAFSLALLSGSILYVIADSRFLGVALVGGKAGLVYVSDFYTPNNNVTYAVTFHNVNFTFLYWLYPEYLPNDSPYTACFLIEFADNSSEVISIKTGDWFSTHWNIHNPLVSVQTEHSSPTAGVLYHGYMDRPLGWKFLVSIF